MQDLSIVLIFFAVLALAIFLLRIDWTPGCYKIAFHHGPTVGVSTRALSGWLRIEPENLRIEVKHDADLRIPIAELRSVELFRLHGTGRMIKIVYGTDTIFVSVVRLLIAGQFAFVDFFKTKRLATLLSSFLSASQSTIGSAPR